MKAYSSLGWHVLEACILNCYVNSVRTTFHFLSWFAKNKIKKYVSKLLIWFNAFFHRLLRIAFLSGWNWEITNTHNAVLYLFEGDNNKYCKTPHEHVHVTHFYVLCKLSMWKYSIKQSAYFNRITGQKCTADRAYGTPHTSNTIILTKNTHTHTAHEKCE